MIVDVDYLGLAFDYNSCTNCFFFLSMSAAENMIRESAYQLYGRNSSNLDSSFHLAVTERAKLPNKEGNAKTIVGEKK